MKAERTLPLLVEIGCEEIPARMLETAATSLERGLRDALTQTRLLPQGSGIKVFYTPRRLAALVAGLFSRQVELAEEVLGPPVRVAYDAQGHPTRAAESFAAKNGVKVTALRRVSTPKGEYVMVQKKTLGQPARRVLPALLATVVAGIEFPTSMYWLGKSGPRFIRPIRWLLALLSEGKGGKVIPFEFAGVRAGDATRGHRVLGRAILTVRDPRHYERVLGRNGVLLDPEKRRQSVHTHCEALLQKSRLSIVKDEWLLFWIVNSTETVSAVLGRFEERFLSLPREILITVMRDQQKYFAVEDREGRLQPQFVAILNLDRDLKGTIRRGHERVLAARFTDAEFFWQTDLRRPFAERLELLASITFQSKLGSYKDKVERMKSLGAAMLSILTDQGRMTPEQGQAVIRAIELAKCDLTTEMVKEFPELQGIVGGLYARAQGEPRQVHEAVYDHYLPIAQEDRCPRSLAGGLVSLTDKLDSVVAGFAVGLEPTGSSDPFALRRQGNGIVKVLLEFSLDFDLRSLISAHLSGLNVAWERPQVEVLQSLLEFFAERVRFLLERVKGIRYDTVNAVLASGVASPVEALARAEALESVRAGDNLEPLSVAAKRIRNILSKSATAEDWQPGEVDPLKLESGPEEELHQSYVSVGAEVEQLARGHDYRAALEQTASLRPLVDCFFDKVLVMATDRVLRENRLRLLAGLDQLFSRIATFSEIVVSRDSEVDASTSVKNERTVTS